jgi:large subunit ribosomal protein LP2
MRHVAAYLLATLGGNETPSAADIKKILGAVGIEADEQQSQDLIAKLEGKAVESV